MSGKKSGGSVSGSTPIINAQPSRKAKCFVCQKPDHKMGDCFFDHKSPKYKPPLKASAEIAHALKKRNVFSVDSEQRIDDQCEFSFMTAKCSDILRK